MARKEAIVVFNGCFCPVHAGHVRALEDAKRKIEADGEFEVTAGYFAVAPDGYVRKKVAELEPWMTAAARVDLCKAVAKDVGWQISAAEAESWKRCGKDMVAEYHGPSTKVFGVREEAKKGGVSRKGDGDTAELSSTDIRAALEKRGRAPEAVDDLIKQGKLGLAVGECLKRHLGAPSRAGYAPGAAEATPAPAAPAGPFRQIRAIYDDKAVILYQAYNDGIAQAAVAGNSFREPMKAGLWKPTRMTWVKPSAVWMAYRCGWTTMKDKNQARVLALHISREGFEELLMGAQLTHSSADQGKCQESPVVVQWDPERAMDPSAAGKQVFTRPLVDVRSIQIGLRGTAVEKLLDPKFVLRIQDVTQRFRNAAAALEAGSLEMAADALWPTEKERPLTVSPRLMEVLAMHEQSQENA